MKLTTFIISVPVTQNNLNNVKRLYLKHVLTVLTGVAGSGKSTLVKAGFENNDHTIFIDQKQFKDLIDLIY